MSKQEFEIFELSNSIKVVHADNPDSEIAHLGVFVDAGSRDERSGQNGIAHFTEHCLFKGTSKRKFYHILNRMDSVGAELDAYTSKEDTCLYSTFMTDYYERSIELISDLLINSTFPEKEMDKEKHIIIDEIQSYLDNPYEQIYDDFEQLIFGKHPIGKTILGEQKYIESLNKKDVVDFYKNFYSADKLTISSVGNIDKKKLIRLLEKYFGGIKKTTKNISRRPFEDYTPLKSIVKKNTNQAHLALGTLAYDFNHPLSDALALLNNIIGGPAMNNRLNMNIRERYGFAYQIESQYITYTDSGVFYIYAGVDHDKVEKTKSLIEAELKQFIKKPLTENQLKKAKKQYIGQIAIGRDNRCNQMLVNGKSLSVKGEVDTIDEIHTRIESITTEQIQQVANELFHISNFSELRYI